MNSFVLKSLVREINYCQYEISLLYHRNFIDYYDFMREVLETFSYITSFINFGSPLYNYILHKIGRSLLEVKKIKNSHIHASNIL